MAGTFQATYHIVWSKRRSTTRRPPSPPPSVQEYVVPFLAEGKPVFNVEYNKDYGLCPKSAELGVDTIFKVTANSPPTYVASRTYF